MPHNPATTKTALSKSQTRQKPVCACSPQTEFAQDGKHGASLAPWPHHPSPASRQPPPSPAALQDVAHTRCSPPRTTILPYSSHRPPSAPSSPTISPPVRAARCERPHGHTCDTVIWRATSLTRDAVNYQYSPRLDRVNSGVVCARSRPGPQSRVREFVPPRAALCSSILDVPRHSSPLVHSGRSRVSSRDDLISSLGRTSCFHHQHAPSACRHPIRQIWASCGYADWPRASSKRCRGRCECKSISSDSGMCP